MFLLDPREPINTWTHALGALLALPSAAWLISRCTGDGLRQISLALFGASMLACYTASTLYHGVNVPADSLASFITLDRVGIFCLIAGTYTPILCVVYKGRARVLALSFVWGYAAACIALYLNRGLPRAAINTGLYLGMGWGGILFYLHAERRLTRRAMLPLLIGGLCYTVGALVNFGGWPNPIDNVFGNHEIFHLFVLAGTACHVYFMARVIAPYRNSPSIRVNVRTRIGNGPLLEFRNHPARNLGASDA